MIEFIVDKELFLKKINLALRFNQSFSFSTNINSGLLLESKGENLNIFSTNLTTFFSSLIKIEKKQNKDFKLIIEGKTISEFVNFLPSQKIFFLIEEKKVVIFDKENKASFPIINAQDYPKPIEVTTNKQKINFSIWQKKLPLVLFAASNDDSRPVLTGLHITSKEESLIFVATDGFRLSLYSIKKEIEIPPITIPAVFISDVLKAIKDNDLKISFSEEEKLIGFQSENDKFYSRLIDGDFPPFERVIPQTKKTSFTISRDDFFKKIKTMGIFAREKSNIIILEIKKDQLLIKPKNDEEIETYSRQEIFDFQGEETRIAFNIKFLNDFLTRFDEEEIVVEVLKPEAPAVFKGKKDKNFLHIIMPVRIAEE